MLSSEKIFELTDLYFDQTDVMFSHLHDSFNKFMDEDITNILKYGDNTFFEKLHGEKVYKYKFEYDNILIKPPMTDDGEYLMPQTACDSNLTYSSKLVASVTQIQEIHDIISGNITKKIIGNTEHNIPIAVIPILVKSKYCSLKLKIDGDIVDNNGRIDNRECKYNPGGYFIINGTERIILSTERLCENKPLVFKKQDSGSIIYSVQVNSRSPKNTGLMHTATIRMKKGSTLQLRVHILSVVPVFVVFRALGIVSDRDIANIIVCDENDYEMMNLVKNFMDNTVVNNVNDKQKKILSIEDAQEYLANKIRIQKKYSEVNKNIKQQQKRMHLIYLLENMFLPHIEGGLINKAYYLGYMINKLFQCYLKRRKLDGRDSFINKRINLVGNHMEELFRINYRKTLNECYKFFKKRNVDDDNPINIINQIKSSIIEQNVKLAIARGIWSKNIGVTQMLQRQSYIQTVSFLRRVDALSNDLATKTLTDPRHYHPSQTGFICPCETPDGHKVGMVKNLSMLASITVASNSQSDIIKNILTDKTIKLSAISPKLVITYTKVFHNGDWVGVTDKPFDLLDILNDKKNKCIIQYSTSIVHNIQDKEIRIYTDGGRLIRLIFNVKNNKLLITEDDINQLTENKNNHSYSWKQFLIDKPGLVDYIDVETAEFAMISPSVEALYKMGNIQETSKQNEVTDQIVNRYDDNLFLEYTHCEIHPSLLLGIIQSNIPFANHNQGPRDLYYYQMGKHAIGIPISNYRDRFDISYVLFHPQRPLVATRTYKYIHLDIMPAGENVIVAICCYSGFGQEDSIILNQSAVERGLFRSMSLKKYVPIIKKNKTTAQDDIFAKPDPSKISNVRMLSYDKLNEFGYVPEETTVVHNDVLIGKISPIQASEGSSKIFKDNSEIYKSHEIGVVDKIKTDIFNDDGYEMKKMRIRSVRIPRIGDKFCCYTGDHDVLTDKGWINIKDLTVDHKVASLYNDNELKYVNPIEVQKYEYNGDIYIVDSNQVQLSVTPNHRMYVRTRATNKYKIELAEDIYNKRRIYKKNVEIYNSGKNTDKFLLPGCENLPELYIDMNAWLVFFGIWIAEGCVEHINNVIRIATHKKRVKHALDKCCEILDIDIRKCCDKKNDENKNSWRVYDKRYVNYLKPLSNGAPHKYLPDWCFDLTMEQSKILIDSMILGDGCYMKGTTTRRYFTSSVRLRDDFQKLCLHAGFSANYYLKSPAGTESKYLEQIIRQNYDHYKLTVVTTQNTPLVNKYKNKLDKYEPFNGFVYCCTIPEFDVGNSGIIYVRKNGIPVWGGNSRNGQKGTCGILLSQSDMPCTSYGLVPDVIANPCAFPGRMTIAQFVECLVGKIAAIKGQEADGTPFERIDIEDIKNELAKYGYDENGNDELYCGITGEKMATRIFIGPTFYHRLKHMVIDKIHSRARGPTTILVRQPPEGRSRDGGLKFGEMERDSIITHGMAKVLKERLMETSDAYTTFVCDVCGLFAQRDKASELYICPACNNKTKISKIRMPYAFKLLLQELLSMSICPRLRTCENIYEY